MKVEILGHIHLVHNLAHVFTDDHDCEFGIEGTNSLEEGTRCLSACSALALVDALRFLISPEEAPSNKLVSQHVLIRLSEEPRFVRNQDVDELYVAD